MKTMLIILGLVNGVYMLIDGCYVKFKGKYIGPKEPGIWTIIFSKFRIDVFKLAPLFIIYGLLWLIWVYGFWTNQSWSYLMGIIMSVFTLWYLPLGTLFSLIILFVLLLYKHKLGI